MKASYEEAQKYLRRLCGQMKFHVHKAKLMHVGKSNPKFTYIIIDSDLTLMTQDHNPGTIIVCSMKTLSQCCEAAKMLTKC